MKDAPPTSVNFQKKNIADDCLRTITSGTKSLSVVGLFAGIGGLEEGFRREGHESVMLCESDGYAQAVLKSKFHKVPIRSDVLTLKSLPRCDILTAGFPCQDLSQVGTRLGIRGPNSGLVTKVLDLIARSKQPPKWLLLENVPFMLKLDGGRAMALITTTLEDMGWSWAYRTIDTRSFGIPQRRRRVILLASSSADPRPILLTPDAGEPQLPMRGQHACGFYWTEGNTGIGWARDAIPPLKGGSGLSIPSPPAIWFPRQRTMEIFDIKDAERLQGFSPDWTVAAEKTQAQGRNKRWRLIGNAVSVPVASWVASRLSVSSSYDVSEDWNLHSTHSWPDAAWGTPVRRCAAKASAWPKKTDYEHLEEFLRYPTRPLSSKATRGFLTRLLNSNLNYDKSFGRDLRYHLKTAEKSASKPSDKKVIRNRTQYR